MCLVLLLCDFYVVISLQRELENWARLRGSRGGGVVEYVVLRERRGVKRAEGCQSAKQIWGRTPLIVWGT